eukprot:Em0009g705a
MARRPLNGERPRAVTAVPPQIYQTIISHHDVPTRWDHAIPCKLVLKSRGPSSHKRRGLGTLSLYRLLDHLCQPSLKPNILFAWTRLLLSSCTFDMIHKKTSSLPCCRYATCLVLVYGKPFEVGDMELDSVKQGGHKDSHRRQPLQPHSLVKQLELLDTGDMQPLHKADNGEPAEQVEDLGPHPEVDNGEHMYLEEILVVPDPPVVHAEEPPAISRYPRRTRKPPDRL